MRFVRSPPAATKVATTSTATSARSANGSRKASRGAGTPALRVVAARSARSICARHSATEYESVGRDRHLVGDRGRRSMRQPGIEIEPTQAVMPARQTQRQQRGKRRRGEQEKDAETDRACDRRQREPQPEPRDREEQADHGSDRGQARPEPFPEDRPARPPQRPRQHLVAVPLRWGSSIGGRVRGTVGQVRLLRSESCLTFDTNTQINACQRAKRKALAVQNNGIGR